MVEPPQALQAPVRGDSVQEIRSVLQDLCTVSGYLCCFGQGCFYLMQPILEDENGRSRNSQNNALTGAVILQ